MARLNCGLDRNDEEGPCPHRLKMVTDHLYVCSSPDGCNAVHWRRPRSKHYPNGERVIFGWGDYKQPGAEAAETSATFGAMWELFNKSKRDERLIARYEGIANRLLNKLRTHGLEP